MAVQVNSPAPAFELSGVVGRSVDEILRLVSALKTGELCPVGWRPGEPFLPPIPKNIGK